MTGEQRTCPNCGSQAQGPQIFCSNCGTSLVPVEAPAPSRVSASAASAVPGTAPVSGKESLVNFLTSVGSERSGVMAAFVVAIVCLAISYAGWWPLSQPSKLIRDVLPEADCRGETPGSNSMYLCSAKVGALQVAGPLILMGAVFVFRRQIKAWLDESLPAMPEQARFLFSPVIATLAFTLSWAGFHYDTADLNGILPQRMFPVVIGLFTYAVARWGSNLQRAFAGFLTWRDTFPTVARIAVLVAVPMLLSYLITNQERVSDTATKEQVVVLVALALGFLMLAPRSGGVLAGMGQTVGSIRAKT